MLAATIVVAAIGVVEMVDGLATVADTAGTLSALLVLFSIVAVAVRVISGRGTRRWPRRAMAGLVGASALLLVLMLVATVRAHTASGRFQDQLAGFPLPTTFESVRVAGNAAHSSQPEYAVRAWRVPPGTDACADLELAFRAWAQGNVEIFSRGDACAAVVNDGTEESEASLSQEDRRLWWRCGSRARRCSSSDRVRSGFCQVAGRGERPYRRCV